MNTAIINHILTATILGLIITSSANASSCGVRDQIVNDTIRMSEFIKDEASGKVKVGEKMKIFTQLPAAQNLQVLGNEGALTKEAISDFDQVIQRRTSYGTVVQVSPCHAITNLHVVEGVVGAKECKNKAAGSVALYKQCMMEVQDRGINIDGQAVAGNFPKSCGDARPEVESVEYKVAAYHKQARMDFNGKWKTAVARDFVVLKTTGKQLENRKYARLAANGTMPGDLVYTLGVGNQELDSDGYSYTHIAADKIEYSSAGFGKVVHTEGTPGKSASGIYETSKKNKDLRLIGFFVGNGMFVGWESIASYLRAAGQTGLLDEIKDANLTGVCK